VAAFQPLIKTEDIKVEIETEPVCYPPEQLSRDGHELVEYIRLSQPKTVVEAGNETIINEHVLELKLEDIGIG
jgi:hypothetical protein